MDVRWTEGVLWFATTDLKSRGQQYRSLNEAGNWQNRVGYRLLPDAKCYDLKEIEEFEISEGKLNVLDIEFDKKAPPSPKATVVEEKGPKVE